MATSCVNQASSLASSERNSRDKWQSRPNETFRFLDWLSRPTQNAKNTWIPDGIRHVVGSILSSTSARGGMSVRVRRRFQRTVTKIAGDRRDRPEAYADFPARFIVGCVFSSVLLQTILLTPVASLTTVNNECSKGCLCIYGKDNQQRIRGLIKDPRLIGAWTRLKEDSSEKVSITYFCSSSSLTTVPQKLTSMAEALFLDDNGITTVRSSDLVPKANDGTVTAPTLVLSMSNNKLSEIEAEAFRFLRNLKLLVLRNNSLQQIQWSSTNPPFLQNLTELDLSLNNMVHFRPADFAFHPHLKRLDLSGNKIQTVDGKVLSKFPKLQYLDLSSNRIAPRGLSPCRVAVPSLRSLSMSENFISEIHSQTAQFLSTFPSLESLDVSGNAITSNEVSSDAFSGLNSLRTLNLSRCAIRNLRQGWLNRGPHQTLRVLDLSHNLFPTLSPHSLSAVFTVDHNVTPLQSSPVLTEKFSSIVKVPMEKVESHWLRPLEQIEILYLNDNRHLTKIADDAFKFLPSLRLLFLQNCAIRRLNLASADRRYGYQPIASTLPELTGVWIHGNPLACDCYVRFIKEWSATAVTVHKNNATFERSIDSPSYSIDSEVKTVNVEASTCVYPLSLAGMTVLGTPSQGMTCQEEPHSIVIAMLIGPLTFAGSIALTILCGSVHVFFAKMKKNAVLSYHAREELMRNPKARVRRRNVPPRIFDGFAWGSPARTDVSSVQSPGRTRHTNLVLGQLGSRAEDQHHSQHLSPGMALARSAASLTFDDYQLPSRNSAGYCSGTDTTRTDRHRLATPLVIVSDVSSNGKKGGSDADSVLGRESVRTRSASSDIPFIDEKGHPIDSMKRSPSSSSDTSLLGSRNQKRPLGGNYNKSESDLRCRRDVSGMSDGNNVRSIPGLSGANSSSEETCL